MTSAIKVILQTLCLMAGLGLILTTLLYQLRIPHQEIVVGVWCLILAWKIPR